MRPATYAMLQDHAALKEGCERRMATFDAMPRAERELTWEFGLGPVTRFRYAKLKKNQTTRDLIEAHKRELVAILYGPDHPDARSPAEHVLAKLGLI